MFRIFFILLLISPVTWSHHLKNESLVIVNQAGYISTQNKQALIWHKQFPLKNFPTSADIVNMNKEKVISRVKLSPPKLDKQSGDYLQWLDFSNIKEYGRYQIKVGSQRSFSFKISNNAYQKTFKALLRAFYLQRCGVPLDDPISGLHHHICHTHDGKFHRDDQFNHKNQTHDATGGWHDAGDYGKYIATTTVAIAHILSLYERHPELFTTSLNIPESNNSVPDVLDEMQVGLDWMLKMQRADGAIYRKLSGNRWTGVMKPEDDKQTRYIYGISTPETAKYAATMALAARVYKDVIPKQAKRYLQAAELAWQYLEKHPQQHVDWDKSDDTGSGKYLASDVDAEAALLHDADDRLWAAAELFLTTKGQQYYDTFKPLAELSAYTLYEWKDASSLGLLNYQLQRDDQLADEISEKILHRAKILLKKVHKSGYQIANDRFVWGSNKMAAEDGITLFYAYKISGKKSYLNAAISQADYLLGMNHFNQSFVTGIGQKPVKNVMHLFARSYKTDVPGLLVGGPNELAQAGFAPKHKGPLSYIDHKRSYATNEFAIDYNATLIVLLGLLETLE